MWKKSGLKKGCKLRIAESMLISGIGDRFIKAEYVSENRDGILLELFFEEGLGDDMKWSYKTFVSWRSIFCGDVKLKTILGSDVKAVLVGRRSVKNGCRN